MEKILAIFNEETKLENDKYLYDYVIIIFIT